MNTIPWIKGGVRVVISIDETTAFLTLAAKVITTGPGKVWVSRPTKVTGDVPDIFHRSIGWDVLPFHATVNTRWFGPVTAPPGISWKFKTIR